MLSKARWYSRGMGRSRVLSFGLDDVCCRRKLSEPALLAKRFMSTSNFTDLLGFIEKHDSLTVLTGAGVSTESNIPDYRGPNGAYTTGFKPVMHQRFVSDEKQRERYWGRSFLGWQTFSQSRPNVCHSSLAQLEHAGKVKGIITQNVDRLHQMAGSKRVLELHGTTWEVICLQPECDYRIGREEFQHTLLSMNPRMTEKQRLQQRQSFSTGENELGEKEEIRNIRGLEETPGLTRPDGDVEVDLQEAFHYPFCPLCGPEGILKPDVTFFGDNVCKQRKEKAFEMVRESDGLLVIGTSLMVFSAFRLATFARDANIPIAVLNQGETRIDSFASTCKNKSGFIKHEAPIGQTMAKILKCMAM